MSKTKTEKTEDINKEISTFLGKKFTDAGLNRISPKGRGSSFDGMDYQSLAQEMGVLNRWQKIRDTDIFEKLINDDELNELSNEIFGDVI